MFANHLQKPTVERLLWDTTIQGTPPFRGYEIWSQKKHSDNLCTYYLYGRDTFIQGKWPIFLGPETRV